MPRIVNMGRSFDPPDEPPAERGVPAIALYGCDRCERFWEVSGLFFDGGDPPFVLGSSVPFIEELCKCGAEGEVIDFMAISGDHSGLDLDDARQQLI